MHFKFYYFHEVVYVKSLARFGLADGRSTEYSTEIQSVGDDL